jgi:hypothetical protein
MKQWPRSNAKHSNYPDTVKRVPASQEQGRVVSADDAILANKEGGKHRGGSLISDKNEGLWRVEVGQPNFNSL